MIILHKFLKLFDVTHGRQVALHDEVRLQVRVVWELIVGENTKQVVHFEAPLVRFEASEMRVRHINVNDVRQKQTWTTKKSYKEAQKQIQNKQ